MQKVFEKIKEKIHQEINGIIVKDTYSKGKNAGLRKAENFINEVAEEYNNGWISVEENSPDKDLKCFVTIKGANSNKAYTVILRYIEEDNIWCWENKKPLSKVYKVLAWKPLMLPEPYQPKGE